MAAPPYMRLAHPAPRTSTTHQIPHPTSPRPSPPPPSDSHPPPDFPFLRAPNPNRASPIPRVPAGAHQTHAICDLSQNALLNLGRYEWGGGAGTRIRAVENAGNLPK